MQQTTTHQTKEYLIFSVQEMVFAFPAQDIEEVVRNVHITYIPGCHESVLGVVHLRGALDSVLDVGRLLGLQPVKPSRESRILVTRDKAMRTGLLVDRVQDFIALPKEALSEDVHSLPEHIRPFASGYLSLDSQQAILLSLGSMWESVVGEGNAHAGND